uniref:Uncharacterized protein n=1 Tax=Amphimedon queenslandica TaxID=400682 RepID=A0A1X7SXR3_AMPQE
MLPLMKWQDLIGCRICKYSLVSALGQCALRNGRHLVKERQTLVVAGCFQDGIAWKVPCSIAGIPQPEPLYNKEADQRIWRHVANCTVANVIVYSPDTDVYTIGIGLTIIYNLKQVIVQLNPSSSRLKRYVNINNLIQALNDDQDLSAVAR